MPNRSVLDRARQLCVLALVALALTPLSAHEVIVEQVVEMTVQPQGDQLSVSLHVPAALSGDRELPALLAGNDAAALETRLRIVAADIAHNLDVEQGDTSLPAPAIAARRGADGASLDIDLRYQTVDEALFSARLNAFTSTAGPARTNARFRTASGRVDLISVTGAPTRVVFDPPPTAVAQQFAVRGLHALLDGGDHLLWLGCLLLPLRRRRLALTLYAGLAGGQLAAIVIAFASPGVAIAWLPAANLIAASALAMAAMQNVAGARPTWVIAMTVLFGVLNGFAFGTPVASATQLAGAHHAAAAIAFTAVVLLGELWLGTLGWMTRRWLDERGVPERGVAILGSVFIAHDALHRLAARAEIVGQTGSFGGDRAIEWIALGWAAAVLLVGVGNAIARAPLRAPVS